MVQPWICMIGWYTQRVVLNSSLPSINKLASGPSNALYEASQYYRTKCPLCKLAVN